MSIPFKSFPDIKKLGNAALYITQKIHGSNAQILIYQTEDGSLDLLTGSRTRWITPENDNFGFSRHVHENKQEFIEKLGVGTHFGEWAGPGINSGEGLSEKTFVLFDHWKFSVERQLPPKTVVVPVLYEGPFDLFQIDICMKDLKINGSKLVSGFMRPEGLVVRIKGERYKVVFDPEETQWTKGRKPKVTKEEINAVQVDHLFQPIRLEKLLSRDEIYIKEYPKSMPSIAKAYMEDLVKENQVLGTEDEIKMIKKAMGKDLFKFIQEVVGQQLDRMNL